MIIVGDSCRASVDESTVKDNATTFTMSMEEKIKELQSNMDNLASQIETDIIEVASSERTSEASITKGKGHGNSFCVHLHFFKMYCRK